MEPDSPSFPPKKLIVAGDRVLIEPQEGEERTKVGLYLPATALEGQQVQEGRIVGTGPGDPIPDPSAFEDEPWRVEEKTPRFKPMQARIGDHAIFFRKAAVEIRFEEKRYLVVPQAAILALVRDELPL
jgi:co-chaperonin GroES (HSP10)